MNYKSKSASDFLQGINNLANDKLKQKEDLERLIDICFQKNKFDVFEKTCFIAKYLQGLATIIQRSNNVINEEIFERYKSEYISNTEQIKDNLQILLEGESEFYRKIFNDKYFSLTQSSISNLNELEHDLSWVKVYLNKEK